ncbi:MAG: hypothetical protein J3R72DRAFT_474998 [Linnemannia gamsii]|nr:MAG: hypothetical protein J3R72DRAFT_474998 [Linnemannia gamsii]
MEFLEATPTDAQTTTTDTAPTIVFSPFPAWTIPVRTGPLYPGRPGRTRSQDLPPYPSPPPPLQTNNPVDPSVTDNGGGGGVAVPTDVPGVIAPIAPIAPISPIAPVAPKTTPVVGGEITFQPGSPTAFRGAITPTASSVSSSTGGGPYTLVPSSVTGLLFAFAFMGTLILGFVAGALFMKYTRFGLRNGSRRQKELKDKEKGDIAEQLRLLTDTLGHRNDRLDREEKYIQSTGNQGDFLPPWYHNRHYSGMYPQGFDRLHPQSAPDQNGYQDWTGPYTSAALGSPVTPAGSPLSSLRQQQPTFRHQPRVINLPPSSPSLASSQSPSAEISDVYVPKGEWFTNGSASSSSPSSNGSAPDLNAFKVGKRRPQMQEEGIGEDSLFDIESPTHNPQATSQTRMINLPPSQAHAPSSSSTDTYGPNGDWSTNGSAPSSPNGSAPNLHAHEVEKRRPQMQEEGIGEDSLFDIENPSHNPHVTSRIF